MSNRKAILAAVIPALLACTALVSTARAQCPGGPGGTTHLRIATTSGQDESAGSYFDLFARLRSGAFRTHSWGRGPAALPGSMRSSFAVLRERLGLTR